MRAAVGFCCADDPVRPMLAQPPSHQKDASLWMGKPLPDRAEVLRRFQEASEGRADGLSEWTDWWDRVQFPKLLEKS